LGLFRRYKNNLLTIINLNLFPSGAVSVHLHFMSNLTKHLFNRGISHGGSAFAQWGVHTPWRARTQTDKIGEYFKCPTKESKALVNCLRKIDPVALVSAQIHLVDWFPFPPVTFVPTVEEDFGQGDLFLEAMPAQLYAEGKVSPKPWILTTTQYEGISAVLGN
jgi:carboxylesterase type B